MRKIVFIFGIFIVFILFFKIMNFTWFNHEKKLNSYCDYPFFKENNFTYQKAEKTTFGEGIAFYQCKFDFKEVPINIQKLTLMINKENFKLKIDNLNLNVLDTLNVSDILDRFRNYIPYQDVLTSPFETLAIMEIENINLNIYCQNKKEEKNQITCSVKEKGKLLFNILISLLKQDGFSEAKINYIQIDFMDTLYLKKYENYIQTLGIKKRDKEKNNKEVISILLLPKDEIKLEELGYNLLEKKDIFKVQENF